MQAYGRARRPRAVAYEVVLEDPHASRQFERAPKAVRDGLRRRAGTLAENPQRGTYARLSRVPRETRQRWEARVGPLENLYKVELPGAWRALYTHGTKKGRALVVILEVVDHTTYDRLLGYG